MGTYYGTTRTNYFKVNDVKRLKWLAEEIMGAELWEKDGFYAFGGTNIQIDSGYDLKDNEINIPEELQKLLPDDQVLVITEVGYEKLKTVNSFCIFITNKSLESISLNSIIEKEITSLGKELDRKFAKENYILDY